MVDFKKLAASKSKPKPVNPREIFNSLPKPPGINDLYASQAVGRSLFLEYAGDWEGVNVAEGAERGDESSSS